MTVLFAHRLMLHYTCVDLMVIYNKINNGLKLTCCKVDDGIKHHYKYYFMSHVLSFIKLYLCDGKSKLYNYMTNLCHFLRNVWTIKEMSISQVMYVTNHISLFSI